jgi:hypothetical protein
MKLDWRMLVRRKVLIAFDFRRLIVMSPDDGLLSWRFCLCGRLFAKRRSGGNGMPSREAEGGPERP